MVYWVKIQVNLSAVKHASELLGPHGELGGHGLIDYLTLHGPQRAQRASLSGIERRLVLPANTPRLGRNRRRSSV